MAISCGVDDQRGLGGRPGERWSNELVSVLLMYCAEDAGRCRRHRIVSMQVDQISCNKGRRTTKRKPLYERSLDSSSGIRGTYFWFTRSVQERVFESWRRCSDIRHSKPVIRRYSQPFPRPIVLLSSGLAGFLRGQTPQTTATGPWHAHCSPVAYCFSNWRALCRTQRTPRTSLIAPRTRIPAAHPPRSRSPSATQSPLRSNQASTSLCRKKAKLPHRTQTNPAREAATRWAIPTRRGACPIPDRRLSAARGNVCQAAAAACTNFCVFLCSAMSR